jgi:hypothetical protein
MKYIPLSDAMIGNGVVGGLDQAPVNGICNCGFTLAYGSRCFLRGRSQSGNYPQNRAGCTRYQSAACKYHHGQSAAFTVEGMRLQHGLFPYKVPIHLNQACRRSGPRILQLSGSFPGKRVNRERYSPQFIHSGISSRPVSATGRSDICQQTRLRIDAKVAISPDLVTRRINTGHWDRWRVA